MTYTYTCNMTFKHLNFLDSFNVKNESHIDEMMDFECAYK